MKKPILLLIMTFSFILFNCQSQSDYQKAGRSDIDKVELNFAKDVSQKILIAQKNGGYYALSEKEATATMSEGLNETLQKESYKKIKNLFGDYNNITFESLMINSKGKNIKIYRFKGDFESGADIEVRTVLNNKGKLAGFFIKPWKDAL